MKKINKGLILTLIVLLILTMYLINVENQRSKEKSSIQSACEKFIELTNNYVVLPENMQESTDTKIKENIEKYSQEMKKELVNQMVSNKEDIEYQHNFFKAQLEKGYNGLETRAGYNRKIIKITKYEFNKEQVKVQFNSKITETVKIGDEEQKSSFETYGDEIILQKIDGNWKIVYSNLHTNLNIYEGYYENSLEIY